MKNIKARLKSLMEKQLTDWDLGFIESVSNQIERGYKLSEKQMNLISKIENKHSPEALRKRDEWAMQYNEEKRKIATICATYYHHHGDWWLSLSGKILDNKSFVPTEKQYNKLTNNKYSKKILKATFEEPKFQAGDLITIRKSLSADAYTHRWKLSDLREQSAVVLSVGDKPVLSPAKGAKVYKVLPFGSTKAYHIEERNLKKMKK